MPVNGMNVGKDYTFGYYDANTGRVVDLGSVQSVKVTATKHDIANRPYNDDPTYGYIPDGYKFAFVITRTSSDLEDFQLNHAARFAAGEGLKPGFLNETIRNADGSVSRYQYRNFVFWVGDLGDISRETVVKMSAEGMASSKVKIA